MKWEVLREVRDTLLGEEKFEVVKNLSDFARNSMTVQTLEGEELVGIIRTAEF